MLPILGGVAAFVAAGFIAVLLFVTYTDRIYVQSDGQPQQAAWDFSTPIQVIEVKWTQTPTTVPTVRPTVNPVDAARFATMTATAMPTADPRWSLPYCEDDTTKPGTVCLPYTSYMTPTPTPTQVPVCTDAMYGNQAQTLSPCVKPAEPPPTSIPIGYLEMPGTPQPIVGNIDRPYHYGPPPTATMIPYATAIPTEPGDRYN